MSAVVAAFAFQVGPAAASTTVSVKTTDGGPIGGTAIVWGDSKFYDDPALQQRESLGACDKQPDGLRVWAYASWEKNGHWDSRHVEDADGAGNGCNTILLPDIPEGTKISIDVCLKDGAHGETRYCGTGSAIA